jgi:cellobiose phosphorylase
VLRRFAHVCRRVGRSDLAQKYEERAEELRKNVNKYGWDGEWYWRASKDDGNLIGSRTCV